MKPALAAAALLGAAAAVDPPAYARKGDDAFAAATNAAPVGDVTASAVTYATNNNFKLGTVFSATATSANKLKDVYKSIKTESGKDTASLVKNTAASPKDFSGKKLGVFDVDVSTLAEGKYVFDGTTTTLAAAHKVTLVVDRTEPKGMDYTMPAKLYIGEEMANTAIPVDKMFTDDVTAGSAMVVDSVKAVSPTHGIMPSTDQQWLSSLEIKGPAGNVVFEVTGRDQAGNTAKALLTVPVYEKPKPSVTVYDARGTTASSSAATYHTGSAATKELTIVATFPEPVKGLDSTWLTVTGGTVATPASSAGGRVWTGKVSFSSYPSTSFTVAVKADAGLTTAKELKTGASDAVTIKVDTTAPTSTAVNGPKAVVGTPFSWPIKLDSSDASVFADDMTAVQDIQMVSATMNADVGLSFTAGAQGAGAYISGKATSMPTTQCNSAAGVEFTITAKDRAGNSKTGTLCIPVLTAYTAGAATTPAMTFSNKAVSFTDGDADVTLDGSATYTGPAAGKIVVQLVTPDVYSASAATAEKLTHATATVTYAQDKAKVGSYAITTGLTTAADVQAALRGIKYSNTLTAPTPGARTLRVYVYDTNGGLAAFQTRTINVAAKNDAPVVKPINDVTWTEGDGEKQIIDFTTATAFIADTDDTNFRSAVVSLARTAGDGTVACDPERDYLKLSETITSTGMNNFMGTWNAKTCQLVLKPTDAKAVSAERFRDALKTVVYGNKDAANPTNYSAGDVAKLVSVTITDDASANSVTVPATSAATTFKLTVSPVDTAPVINFPAAYGKDGFLFGTSRFGQTESFVDTASGETITHRRFVAAVDTSSSDALSLSFSFDLAKRADGVFAAGDSITDADNKDLASGYNAGVVCATTITSESADCSDVSIADVTFTGGKLTFKVTATSQSSLSSLVGNTKYFQMLYGSDSDQVSANFGVQIMEKKCASDAAFDATKHIPTPEKCYDANGNPTVSATSVDPRATTKATIKSTAWTAQAADLDAAVEAQSSTGSSYDEQVEAMRSLRQKSRGSYAMDIEPGSFTAVGNVDVRALPPAKKIINALPPVDADHKVDSDVALQLSPAGTKFTKPVKVCVHVGDADSGYSYKFAIASEVDPLNPSKGYGPWEDLIDQTYDARSGRLCGYTTHFSVAAPVLVPVSADPTQQKKFNMGGSCPNDCSNKGFCRENGKCACFAGFTGYDCSARTCPAAESWDTADGIVHKPAECSNRGACDAKTGACACYKGFEGSACQRVACPNDCSGNGKCRFLSELPKAQSAGYSSWEASRIQVCQCDGGYTGPDCSQRLCPFGDDPETVCHDDARQVQAIKLEFVSPPETPSVSTNDEMALAFTTATGSNFTTFRVVDVFDAASGAASLTNALKALPMFAVSDVAVSGTATANDITWKITFDDSDRSLAHLFSSSGSPTGAASTVSGNTVAGNQALLQCPTIPGTNFLTGCTGAGCRPQFKQMRMEKVTGAGATISSTAILTQPARADGAFPSTWGVEVTVTIATVNGAKTYKVDSSVYGGGITPSDALAAQLLPPAGLRKGVPLVYGLAVDFDDSDANIPDGTIVFKWLLPTCTVTQDKAADPDYESLECSRRGVCDRKTGECQCFNGYTGVSCSQQTVMV